jgi:hypothetical protein
VIGKCDPHGSCIRFVLENALEKNALKHPFLATFCCPTSPLPPFAFFCTIYALQTSLSKACCYLQIFLLAP